MPAQVLYASMGPIPLDGGAGQWFQQKELEFNGELEENGGRMEQVNAGLAGDRAGVQEAGSPTAGDLGEVEVSRRRRGKGYEVLSVRELSADEVKHLRRAKLPAAKRLRHAHHRLALLIATGLSDNELSILTGYSIGRIASLKADPAFRDLISVKHGMIEAHTVDQIAEYNQLILTNGIKAEQLIADKLDAAIDDEADDIPWAVLLKASRDAADRVGLAKRSVALNVNVDFASQLHKAVQRSRMKVIDNASVAQSTEHSVVGREVVELRPTGSAKVIEAAPAGPPTPSSDALAQAVPERAEGAGVADPSPRSPGPVLIHASPGMKPAPVPTFASLVPGPGLVSRRTA